MRAQGVSMYDLRQHVRVSLSNLIIRIDPMDPSEEHLLLLIGECSCVHK
jgi:hypothetical protein